MAGNSKPEHRRIPGRVRGRPHSTRTSGPGARRADRSAASGESRWALWLQGAHPSLRASARNLVHYWAMCQRDLHHLQQSLAYYGVFSLGRSESHVAASLTAVRALVKVLREQMRPADVLPTHARGAAIIPSRAVDLLGPELPGRPARIMVTLPSEAADDPSVMSRLVGREWTSPASTAPTTTPRHGPDGPPHPGRGPGPGPRLPGRHGPAGTPSSAPGR